MSKFSPYSLWMGNLEPWMDEEFIMSAFSEMGQKVNRVKIIKHRASGLLTGYCFVDFPDEDSSRKAMLQLNGKMIPGSQPPVRFKLNEASFNREDVKDKEHSMFIGELSEDVDDFALYSAFQKKYKSVKAAKVMIDSDGSSRGFGFVRFTDVDEWKLALIQMNHYVGLGKKPIRVSLATPKRPGSYGGSSYSQGGSNYNQYYPQYPPQDYYNQSWWQSYQTPSQYYNSGTHYSQGSATSQSQSQPDNTEEELEEPELEIDVAKANEEFMERSEEVYVAVEGSRWHPLDHVLSPIDVPLK